MQQLGDPELVDASIFGFDYGALSWADRSAPGPLTAVSFALLRGAGTGGTNVQKVAAVHCLECIRRFHLRVMVSSCLNANTYVFLQYERM